MANPHAGTSSEDPYDRFMRMIGRVYTHVLVVRETWGQSMGMVRPGKWLHVYTLSMTYLYTHRWYKDLCEIVHFGCSILLYYYCYSN